MNFQIKNPMVLYNHASEAVKSQFKSLEMIKILRSSLIEIYHYDKIKKIFLEDLVENLMSFSILPFQNFTDKNIIRKEDPKKLAESYHNYNMFKVFETITIKYPEYPLELNINPYLVVLKKNFQFILNYMAYG